MAGISDASVENLQSHPAFQRTDFSEILRNNRKYVESRTRFDPEYFKKLSTGQSPQYLYIGCADSRVPVEQIMGLSPGDIFVHRNVANLVVTGDMNFLAVLQYSVEVLKVKDIIVCGHYGCGGVQAASTVGFDHGLLENWLKNIRDVQRLHLEELEMLKGTPEYQKRLVELNVQEQCMNLYFNPIVQKSQIQTGFPRVHGFVYDLKTGNLKNLQVAKIMKRELYKYDEIYGVHSVKRSGKELWDKLKGKEMKKKILLAAKAAKADRPASSALLQAIKDGNIAKGYGNIATNREDGEQDQNSPRHPSPFESTRHPSPYAGSNQHERTPTSPYL
eukprot:CAMPEP_0113937752 /NCGR_PEP_ID=MMETSP1339-20121228/4302_1 /TAXON_ID=94617 /ORGANISM="Fibrocapsa japonica" /LENGTH=331 /DNA_ID=CAMNT_0000940635 /DNA_START=92 /DNA_END=1087 /DNA_ORIENTATION=+ /assembly_acc=CAM_ASM_000762